MIYERRQACSSPFGSMPDPTRAVVANPISCNRLNGPRITKLGYQIYFHNAIANRRLEASNEIWHGLPIVIFDRHLQQQLDCPQLENG